jgi:hypothetical protein
MIPKRMSLTSGPSCAKALPTHPVGTPDINTAAVLVPAALMNERRATRARLSAEASAKAEPLTFDF